MKLIRFFALSLAALSLLPSCGRGGNASASPSGEGDTLALSDATNLSIIEHPDFTEVRIRNPWDTTRLLHSYALIERDAPAPSSLDPALTPVRVPLQKSVVFSGVHASLIAEFGHLDAVDGVCDVDYIFDPLLKERIADGKIIDCGNNTSPNMERIISISPEAVLLSPYESTAGHGKLDRMGVPVIECADYMEPSPLGRAEWMKFYGRLFGEGAAADSIFKEERAEYLRLKKEASLSSFRPAVVFDRIYGNAWYVPEKYSTTGRFIEDAGGRNPFSFRQSAGSAPLSPEEVFLKGKDAGFWFIRHAGEKISYSTLGNENPLYPRFEAFGRRSVFVSDTSKSHIFEDAAFHPHFLLADMISILHPEIPSEHLGFTRRKYYTPLK